MTHTRASGLTLFTALFAAHQPALAQRAAAPSDAFSVIAEFDRLAARDLWPGFHAAATPIALFDGERTLLFRHPSPPPGFSALTGRSDVLQMPGRLDEVTSNSSAKIGGVMTATLMPSPGSSDRSRAGTAIHEAFHVFQRTRHPGWGANEADLFTYPMNDPAQLAARRREYALLRRALGQRDSASSACDAFVAVIERRTRLEALGAAGATYERKNELNEGLASYVQARATSAPFADVAPDSTMSADAIRWYAYVSGPVLGRLLDRFAPSWRDSLEANDKQSLDELLGAALARTNTERPMCGLTPSDRASIDAGAARAAAALAQSLVAERTRFLAQTGWRLEIDASRQSLLLQGFDPLNVHRVTPGEVLHTRFVKLGGSTGSVEVLGRGALSEAAGAHPLFNGVRRVTITGLDKEPVVRDENGEVAVSAPGVTVRFRGASVTRENGLIRVTLPN
jgi:hypothetical protein